MGFRIKKQRVYELLFMACILVPYFNIYEATFFTWSVVVLITLRKKYSLTIVKQLACFSAILLIAFIVCLFDFPKPFDFAKDIAYMLKPILGLLIGYQLCKEYFDNPFIIILRTGIVLAVFHMLNIAYAFTFLHIRDMPTLRMHTGYFSDFEVYAIIILIFRKQLGLEISYKKVKLFLPLLIFSTALYLARSNFIQFAILYVAMKGYFVADRRSLTILALSVIILGGGYTAIYYSNPSRTRGAEAFFYKIKNAPKEAFKTHVNKYNWKDLNDNYRSYETIMTYKQVTDEGPATIAFGKGLGSKTDLRTKMWLQTSFMRFIPFLHNGFTTVFLKSGLAGVILLLVSILLLFKNKPFDNSVITNINLIIVGTGVYLFVSYWVFLGFYFIVDTKAVIFGFLVRYRENIARAVTNRMQ
ncbi:putative polysaccharide biosynthesis protein [Flavobacterium beibuense]|uniref:Putative polysaccharide biosynthesis protein n=1 Tax=Flavobacterium beibuense TaxID=657326 RepID=A0A444WDW5_9FLAO|nr:putative polysaccharide biosynthesis protein [Flavobacterium beibuense]